MEELLFSLLMKMNEMQGIRDTPASVPMEWNGTNSWSASGSQIVFEAESAQLLTTCRNSPSGFIKFPVVLYGSQEIFFDGVLMVRFGNPQMNSPNFVVSAPTVPCRDVLGLSTLGWRVTAYSRYFARVMEYPSFVESYPWTRLFGETLYIGSAIGLLVLAVFAFCVLYRKESWGLTVALTSAILGSAIYQFSLVAPAFEITAPMISIHRFGDPFLSLGIFFVIMCFWIEKLVPKRLFQAHLVATLLGWPFYIFGTNGDTIQFGTSIPMPTALLCLGFGVVQLTRNLARSPSWGSLLTLLFSLVFFCISVNDISVFTGSSSGYTFMSVGILPAFLILVLAVSTRISAAYTERDFLRQNLQEEVVKKTAELKKALVDLKHTQAELVESAKLATLGTLAAGIAHEINNSINYVNGALVPLEKKVMALVPEEEKPKLSKLFGVMKNGTTLTIEIIKSLRNYTGLNHAEMKDVKVEEVVSSVLTILKTKILTVNAEIEVKIETDLSIFCHLVGINQILMNLLNNALDAVPSDQGKIQIDARRDGEFVRFQISDNGAGIPEKIVGRIFDPFFTTKDVGKGTGLGLHIAKKEIERHGGKISLSSIVNQGTSFEFIIPLRQSVGSEAA